jgi:hypothetical protein
LIDDLDVGDLLQPLQRKEPAGTVAQPAFQPGAVVAFHARRGIQREALTVVPAHHVPRIGLVELAGAGESAQHASAQLLL